ncbi:MAG: hypothetical protein PHY47_00280 [Lachnospiraceae bacterium]|nr:hypothetical protein [Lachnospiraceae bacterium]
MKPITSIPSLIASLQSNKIVQKMKEDKQLGLFRSESEYNQELKRELIAVANNENKPVFNFIPVTNGLAYSDYINKAMDQILLDLEVAFSEINYLFSKIASHEAFYNKSILEIQSLISKLERRLEAVSIEAGLDTIYNKSSFDSFLDRSMRMSPDHPSASEGYFDNREEKQINALNFAYIDTDNGKLCLPKYLDKDVSIANIQINTSETTVSDFDIQIPGSLPSIILDTTSPQTWSYNILKRNKLEAPAVLSLEVDLGDKKEINQLLISPSADVPAYIKSISYQDENGEESIIEVEDRALNKDQIYSFPKVIARRIKIVLEQDRSKLISFSSEYLDTNLEDIQRNNELKGNLKSITSNVIEQIKDPNIKGILGINQNPISNNILLNNYVFSLKSIEAKLSDYRSKGVYTSIPSKFNKPSLIAFQAKETVKNYADILTGQSSPEGTIEYAILKKDYTNTGKMIDSSLFPVLPIGQTLISNEYLPFSQGKILPLRFLGHDINGDASSVKLYRNGVELIRGVDWCLSDRANIAELDSPMITANTGNTRVEILQNNEQIINGTFYAEYVPRYVLNPESNVVDRGIRYLESGATVHPITAYGEEISYSDISVQIIIRSYDKAGLSTPVLDFYRLNIKEESNE